MFTRSLKLIGMALAATALVGCSLLYPRFDNPLNPDIAFLNAGDVVDSVKCAVTTFFIKHRTPIEEEARKFLQAHLPKPESNESFYCRKERHWADPEKDPKEWQVALLRPKPLDGPNPPCVPDFEVMLKADAKNITIIRKGEQKPHIIPFDDKKEPFDERAARELQRQLGEDFRRGRSCEPTFYHAYKYIKLEAQGNKGSASEKLYRCVPNGGCRPGTFLQEEGKCVLDEAGSERFVIDPDSNAKIELSLTASNQGSMNYTKIDGTKLGILNKIIVPGDSSKGFPFPMLKALDKKTNKVEITLVMSQGRIQEDKKEGPIDKLISNVKAARILALKDKAAIPYALELPRPTRPAAENEELRRKVLAALSSREVAGEYNDKCAPNALKVGFLGLADYIDRIVTDQNANIYKGTPEINLDNFVLTSSFQISFDAAAGTKHIFRIVPVLSPPTLQLNPDHTHQLRITFSGTKGRATKARALAFLRKCISRLQQSNLTPEKAEAFCNEPSAILMETLIDAVENSKSAGSN
jgi:hypothetical protein